MLPALDVGLAALAVAIWYVRPQEGAWPLGLVGVAWLLRLVAYGSPTRATPFDFPLTAFLLTAYVGATVGYNQATTWNNDALPLMWAWAKYWLIVGAVALFFAVANLRAVNHLWWFIRAYVVFAAIVAVYFAVTNTWGARGAKFDLLSQIGSLVTQSLPDVPGRRLNPNIVGGVIATVLPFAVPLLVEARQRTSAFVLWALVALVATLGLVLTGSRGAWLALVVVGLAWALAREFGGLTQRRVRLRALLLAVMLLSVLGVVASMSDLGTVGGAPIAGPTGTSTVISRLNVWQGAWALGQDYLFTGAGLGTFPLAFSAYYELIPVLFLTHGHNLFLDLLVEQGAGGLLAFVWLTVTLAVVAVRDLRVTAHPLWSDGLKNHLEPLSPDANRMRGLLQAALASAAVVVLHGLVDDAAFGSRALALLFVPAAVVAATHAQLPRGNVRVPWRAVAVVVALVALAALWQRDMLIGMWYANRGALTQAQVELGAYRSPDRLPESVRRNADLRAVVAQFTRALQSNASNRTANQRLGAIALARGQYDAARAYLEATYQRDPTNETTWQLLGDAYLALGRIEDAHTLWSRVADAPNKLSLEAGLRYEPIGDKGRAQRANELAARIRAERSDSK